MDRVAVVIPTYDRAELVVRAVESVLAQTRSPDAVIVVDDGSRDGTKELLEGRGWPIQVLRQERRGVSAARNRGIRAAAGCRWIAFLDSDDEWRPHKLERQLEALAAEPGAVLCHTEEIWIRRGNQVLPRRIHRKRGGRIFRHCLPRCAISPSSAVLLRDVLDEVGTFDESLPACEDYDLWLRICSRYPVVLVDEPLVVKHGGHRDQLSRRYPALDRFRIRALDNLLRSGELSSVDEAAARAELEKKLEIYVGGALRRGRGEEVAAERAHLEELRQRAEESDER